MKTLLCFFSLFSKISVAHAGNIKRRILVFFILCSVGLSGIAQLPVVMQIQEGNARQTISRHIYGHFAEHLGRCIYDGFWVSDSLNVPKKDRIRLDVVFI